jgi:hypothetical protein
MYILSFMSTSSAIQAKLKLYIVASYCVAFSTVFIPGRTT